MRNLNGLPLGSARFIGGERTLVNSKIHENRANFQVDHAASTESDISQRKKYILVLRIFRLYCFVPCKFCIQYAILAKPLESRCPPMATFELEYGLVYTMLGSQ